MIDWLRNPQKKIKNYCKFFLTTILFGLPLIQDRGRLGLMHKMRLLIQKQE